MIRKSVEPGTKVFHEIYGFGIFKDWFDNSRCFAQIQFDESITPLNNTIPRKTLTEIVGVEG